MRTSLRRMGRFLAAVCITAATIVVLATPASATSPDIVLSEVYGGGGNSGAQYHNDFIELYNRGTTAINVSGWSVQYASAGGTTWSVTSLSGSIAPGSKYLIQEAAGAGGGAALPTPDATGTISMSATSGKVALVTNSTALGCGSNCHAAAGVKDYIGYGSANDYEGSPAATLSNTTSATRTPVTSDTDNNATDFAKVAPTPENSAGGGGGNCPGYTTRIRDIQGAAHISPKNGQSVSNVRGVVTAKKSNGFYYQDPCPDTGDATSEGLFVYTASAPSVSVGQEIAVNGSVSEYRPGGASSANLTTTEITSPSITVLGTRALPPPIVVGSGGRVPPNTVIKNNAACGNVETCGTFDPATQGLDFWESLEGMLVSVNNPVAVGPYNATYGEIPIVADEANSVTRTGRGGILLKQSDGNPEKVTLADDVLAGSTPSGTNVGDHFSGPATGTVDYIAGFFEIQLTSALSRVSGGLAKEITANNQPGEISIATFNVENLDPNDPQSKFDGLAADIITNLKSPGILNIEEIQDNNGPTDDGTVAADQTWNKLINTITTLGGPPYTYKQINPVNNSDGGEPGGNIRVGFLFRTDIGLTFAAGTPGGSTTAETVLSSGIPSDPVNLGFNPGRIDPTNSAWSASRKPLVGKFYFNSKPLFVIANHFVSKGGDDPLLGKNQPPNQPSTTKRGQQASVEKSFIQQILAIDPNARIVVAGDLNDFEYSSAVQTLVSTPLTDLPATLSDAERYSYVFLGNSQVLDHLMLSSVLAGTSYSYDVVHVNSEFAVQDSDHEPQVVRLTLP